MRSWSRTTRRWTGRSASAGWRARARSIRRAPSLSDAAAAGEILGRAARARCAQARPASVSGAAGDQLAALSRPAGVHSLRLLPRLGCEVGAKASTLTTMIPEAEATGRCEVRSESYVCRSTPTSAAARPGCAISIATSASAFRRRKAVVAVRERRRDAATAAHVGESACSRRGSRTPAAWSAST